MSPQSASAYNWTLGLADIRQSRYRVVIIIIRGLTLVSSKPRQRWRAK